MVRRLMHSTESDKIGLKCFKDTVKVLLGVDIQIDGL